MVAAIKDLQNVGVLPRWPDRRSAHVWARVHQPTRDAVSEALEALEAS